MIYQATELEFATAPATEPKPKVYIFGSIATAEAFKMTAFAFGYDAPQVRQVGSALVMPEFVYNTVTDKTYAIPAAMVCEECEK